MKGILIGYFIMICGLCWSQKSLTIEQAYQSLQKNNLVLLAEQYNITAAQAGAIQAKIWELPYVSAEFNALNPQENRNFDVGSEGQKAFAIQQLIYLGGKKKNEVAFAKGNISLAQLQFEQVLRTLKYQLAANFFTLYFDSQKIKSLEVQISKLDTLVQSYKSQADKGNVPLKEVVRLQTLLINLTNERTSYQKDILDYHQNLALLIGITERTTPMVSELDLEKFNAPKLSKEELIMAVPQNPEYRTALTISQNQEIFIKWQKSLSTPDITTGASYDQRGGAFKDQVNITLGIPLPLWDRNKGNIRLAEAQWQQAKTLVDYKKQGLIAAIETAWQNWQQQYTQLGHFNQSVRGNLETVFLGTLTNFQKRNISLIEFTDFMESYNQATIQLNEIKKKWVLASLQLNYASNSEVF